MRKRHFLLCFPNHNVSLPVSVETGEDEKTVRKIKGCLLGFATFAPYAKRDLQRCLRARNRTCSIVPVATLLDETHPNSALLPDKLRNFINSERQ